MRRIFRLALEAVQNLPTFKTADQFTRTKAMFGWLLALSGHMNDHDDDAAWSQSGFRGFDQIQLQIVGDHEQVPHGRLDFVFARFQVCDASDDIQPSLPSARAKNFNRRGGSVHGGHSPAIPRKPKSIAARAASQVERVARWQGVGDPDYERSRRRFQIFLWPGGAFVARIPALDVHTPLWYFDHRMQVRFVSALVLASAALAQQPGPGHPQPPLHDELLDQLVGFWDLTGMLRGEPVHERVYAEWMLNHQFLAIHRKSVEGPDESILYIGFDPVSERYVAHRLDTLGGRGSETLGYGIRSGDKIQFVFEYPSGPYHFTVSWDAAAKSWQFVLESKDRQGHWSTFATQTLRPVRGGRGLRAPPLPPVPQPPALPQ